MKRLTFKDGKGRNTLLVNGQEYHGPIADRLAAYEDIEIEPNDMLIFSLDPEASAKIAQTILNYPVSLRNIADVAESMAPVLTLMGGDVPFYFNIRMWIEAFIERRLMIMPPVKDEAKQSVLDLYRDARNEWIHDPSVGLYGPNEDEAALMDAVEKVLEVKDETNL